MSIKEAFNALLFLHKRTVSITRFGKTDPENIVTTINISPSNYYRHLSGPEEITVAGREFVVSRSSVQSSLLPNLKKGDQIEDSEMGLLLISEVREMFNLGGEIIGYRIRTS